MINFPYRTKSVNANTTYIEPIDIDKNGQSQSLDNLCDTLITGYTTLVEDAIDNKKIFEKRCIPIQGINRLKLQKPSKVGLKKLFGKKHPLLSINPNPKNLTGSKGQSIYRFLNGNIGKLWRVKYHGENLSEGLLLQYNKLIDIMEDWIDNEWLQQDFNSYEIKYGIKEAKSQSLLIGDFRKRIRKLKIKFFNNAIQQLKQQNQKLFNTGLFDADDNNGDAV